LEENNIKRLFTIILVLLFLIFMLSGCNTNGVKNTSLSAIYQVTAFLSLVLMAGCIRLVRQKRFWFILLFASVFVVNTGYTFLSVSSCLEAALLANRISYLGSVFLPLSMLMIILNVTNTAYHDCLPKVLSGIAVLVFLIAASPGILPVYYKEVSFAVINGVSRLVKVYGPLHSLYFVYLLGYFASMVLIILRAHIRETIDSTLHAVILALAVFVNIGVWFIEQLVSIDFEFLSISYIISELFLLGVHLVMNENQRLRVIIRQTESAQAFSEDPSIFPNEMLDTPIEGNVISPESIELFINGLKVLTPTEKAILDAHLARVTSKEIMASMNIKESTLKYHNRNLYGKLGVSNRKELLEIYKYIKSVKIKMEYPNTNVR